MLLSIIIVSYNTKDLTLQTIKSAENDILDSDLLKNQTEILVVDNNSGDDSVNLIKKYKKKSKLSLKIYPQKENLGFGKANNLAIEKSKGKYVLLLNSDTIVRKGALEQMVTRFENYKGRNNSSWTSDNLRDPLGILAATLLNSDLTLQPQGGSLPTLTNLFFHMSMLDDLPLIGKFLPSTQHTGLNVKQQNQYTSSQNHNLLDIDWVGGTAMMIPREALSVFGTLDQNIFMYGEDMELCLRARNHGFRVAIDPDAQVIHLKNQSSTSENAIRGEFKGYLYIFSKHEKSLKTQFAKIFLQMGAIFRIIVFASIAINEEKQQIYLKVLKDLA